MTRESWQRTKRALVVAALSSLAAFWLLEFWLFRTSPKLKNQALGAINPINWHGTIVYVTAAQQFETDALFWGGVTLLMAAVTIDLWVRPFRK
jgi:hypothetical protein